MRARSAIARTDELDPTRILAPNPGFGVIAEPVTLTVDGIVLDCPRCEQPTTAFLAFLPSGDPTWDQSRIVLCNSDLALALAEAATPEITHIVNAVGRPSYTAGPDLVNRCFHCDQPLTGDDLAAVCWIGTSTLRSCGDWRVMQPGKARSGASARSR